MPFVNKIPLFALPILVLGMSACGHTQVIEKPVPVEIVRTEYVPVPDRFLVEHQPSTIPESATYGEVIQLWSSDRDTIKVLLAQIRAIKDLDVDGAIDNR